MAYGHPGRSTIRFGMSGGVPRDVVVLIAIVFATFSLQFFGATAWLTALLRLTPLAWQLGFVWQLVTYPLAGTGGPSPWILLELLVLFWFGRDVFWRLRRRAFWRLLAWSCVTAAVVALAVDALARLTGLVSPESLALVQGQRMLITVLIAAFAVLFRDAQILLFFVLPVQARWFIPLEVVIAFIAFLATHDLAGFIGLCVAIGMTWAILASGGLGGAGREGWLRLQRWWLKAKMGRLRRKRGFRVVEEPRRDPWLH